MGLWKLLTFETEVRLYGDAAPDEIAGRLAAMVAPRCSWGKRERAKLMRGTVALNDGFVRWPLNEYRLQSPRILRFDLEDAPCGTVLNGRLRVTKPVIFTMLGYLALGTLMWLWIVIHEFIHGGIRLRPIWQALSALGIVACMTSAYLWFIVAVGRSRDRALIRLLRVALASSAGAGVARDLLSPDRPEQSFMDDPR